MERSNGGERTQSKCRKDEDHDLWYAPGPPAVAFSCAICRTGVGSNNIFCNNCKHWVHENCSGHTYTPTPSGCELSTTTHVKTAWKKFKELLAVFSSDHLSFKTRGRMYSSCVQSAMLHASETWPLLKPNLQCLQLNEGNDQTDLQCQAARHCHHQVQ